MEKLDCKLIVFDGNCGFCNHTMIFIARNDFNNQFKLVSNQSEIGLKVLKNLNIKPSKADETIILIEENNFYYKSVAISKILLVLPKYKLLGKILKYFPKRISDFFYSLFSNHRKKFIKNNCKIPNEYIRKKFIL